MDLFTAFLMYYFHLRTFCTLRSTMAFSNTSFVSLSQSRVLNVNMYRKRPLRPDTWKNQQAKLRRNSGQPYVNSKGVPKSGILCPTEVKVCRPLCQLPGCMLPINVRQDIFVRYQQMRSYDVKHTYLMGQLSKIREGAISRYRYDLTVNGVRMEVCKLTFLDTYKIGKKTVEILQRKLSEGQIAVSDGRGRHLNRPNRITEDLKLLIQEHINSFPKYDTHYSRNKHGDKHLSSDLTLKRMFELFLDTNRGAQSLENKEQTYRIEFRKTGLKIGTPYEDTCKKCDGYYVRLLSAATEDERLLIENEMIAHHTSADIAYVSMYSDFTRSKIDANYVVKGGDLQQILLCPTMTHSDMFYKRQYTTYNYCLYDGGTANGTMVLWHEVIGHRGVDEIASALLHNITSTLMPLAVNANRTLTFWSDRCRGQANNWPLITAFIYLVNQKYFTTINQKFLVTGHSFLPCDRLFASIEKKKKTAKVMVPSEWEELIRQYQPNNPFLIQNLTQELIWDVKQLTNFIPKPGTLKVTEVAWIQINSDNPHVILTRPDHGTGVRDCHLIRQPVERRIRILNRPLWNGDSLRGFQFQKKYQRLLPISREKRSDLMSTLPFLLPRYHEFYTNLPYEQIVGNENVLQN